MVFTDLGEAEDTPCLNWQKKKNQGKINNLLSCNSIVFLANHFLFNAIGKFHVAVRRTTQRGVDGNPRCRLHGPPPTLPGAWNQGAWSSWSPAARLCSGFVSLSACWFLSGLFSLKGKASFILILEPSLRFTVKMWQFLPTDRYGSSRLCLGFPGFNPRDPWRTKYQKTLFYTYLTSTSLFRGKGATKRQRTRGWHNPVSAGAQIRGACEPPQYATTCTSQVARGPLRSLALPFFVIFGGILI